MGIGNGINILTIITGEDIRLLFQNQDTITIESEQTLQLNETLVIPEGKTLIFRGSYTAPPDMDSFDIRGTLVNEGYMDFGNMDSGVVGISNSSGNTKDNKGNLYFDSSGEDSVAIRAESGSKSLNYGRITIRQIEPKSIGILVEDDAVYENYGVIECKSFGQKRLTDLETGGEDRFFGHDFDLEIFKEDNSSELLDTIKITGLEDTHFIKTEERGLFINYNSGYLNMSEMNRKSIVFESMTAIMNNGYFVNMGNMLNTTIKNNRNFINGNCNEEYRYDDSIYQKEENEPIDFTTLDSWCVATREGKPKYLRQCGTIKFTRITDNWKEKRRMNIDGLFELLFFKQFFTVAVSNNKKTTIADMFDHLKNQEIERDIILMIPGWMSKFILIPDRYKNKDNSGNIITQVMHNEYEIVDNIRYSHNHTQNYFLSWNDIKSNSLNDDDDYRVVAFFLNVILNSRDGGNDSLIAEVQSTEYNKAWENARNEYFSESPERHELENDLSSLFTIDATKKDDYIYNSELKNDFSFVIGGAGLSLGYGISPKMIDNIDPNYEYLKLLELITNKVGNGASLTYDNLKTNPSVGADDSNERRQGRVLQSPPNPPNAPPPPYAPPDDNVNFLTTEKSIGIEENQLDIAGPLQYEEESSVIDLTGISVMKGYFSVFKDAPQHEDAPNNFGDSVIPKYAASYSWVRQGQDEPIPVYFAYKQFNPIISTIFNRVDQPPDTSRFNLTYYFDFDKDFNGRDLAEGNKLYDYYDQSEFQFILRWWGEELKVGKKTLESLIGFYPNNFKTYTDITHDKITNGIQVGVRLLGAIDLGKFGTATASFHVNSRHSYSLRCNEFTSINRSSTFFENSLKSLTPQNRPTLLAVNNIGAGMALGDYTFGYVDYDPDDKTNEYFKSHIDGAVEKNNDGTHLHTFENEDTVQPSDYISNILETEFTGNENTKLLHKAGLPKYVGLLICHETLHGLGLVAVSPLLRKLDKEDLVEVIYIDSLKHAYSPNVFDERVQRGLKWFKIFKGPIATQAYKNLLKDMYVNHIQLKDSNGNAITGNELQLKKDSINAEIEKIQGIPYVDKDFPPTPPGQPPAISQMHWLLDNIQRGDPDRLSLYESAPEITVNGITTKYPLLHLEMMGSGGTLGFKTNLSPMSLSMLEDLGFALNKGARTIDAQQSQITFLDNDQLRRDTNDMNNILPHPLKSSTQIIVRPTFKKEGQQILPDYETASLFGFPDGTNGRQLPYDYGNDVALPIKLNSRKKWHKTTFRNGSAGYFCKVVVDSTGKRHLVSYDTVNSKYNLYYRTSTNGVEWDDQILIETGNTDKLLEFNLKLDSSNNLYLLYRTQQGINNNNNRIIKLRKLMSGANEVGFRTPITIATGSYDHTTLDIDSDNKIHIGYTNITDIYYKVSDENGNFNGEVETVKTGQNALRHGSYLTSSMIQSSTKPVFVYSKRTYNYTTEKWELSITTIVWNGNTWVDLDNSETSNDFNHGKNMQIHTDYNDSDIDTFHYVYYNAVANALVYQKFDYNNSTWSDYIKLKTYGIPKNSDVSFVVNYGSPDVVHIYFYDKQSFSKGTLKYVRIEDTSVQHRKIDYEDDYSAEFNIGEYIDATLDNNNEINLVYQLYRITDRRLIYNFLH